MNTVEKNMEGFTDRQIEMASKARRLQHIMGLPCIQDFKAMVQNNMIKNCPITLQDIATAEQVYGKSVGVIKGKVTRQKPEPVITDYVEVPKRILDLNKEITLSADIMYVQGMPFFITVSRDLKLTTTELMSDKTQQTILNCITNIQSVYKNRGFEVKTLLMDREIIPVVDNLRAIGIEPNPTSANEHVPEVERQIRIVKERVSGLYNTLPYETIPKIMMEHLVYYVVGWLNNFPVKSGISKILSPRTLITGVQLDHNKHCLLEFGEYVQVHEENSPTNSMEPRATGAIALGSTYTLQGGYKFLSLNTGRIIHRRSFTRIPLTQDVKARVEQMARHQGRPSRLGFQNRLGTDLEDQVNDSENELNGDEEEYSAVPAEEEDREDELPEEEEADNEEDEIIDPEGDEVMYTRSGRKINKPRRLIPSFTGQ